MELPAAILLVGYVGAFAGGIYFRRAKPGRWAQQMLVLTYRNRNLSRAMRNGLLIVPVLCTLLLPLLAIAAVVVINGGNPPNWPYWARSLTVWGLFAYFLLVIGGVLVLAYREPAWLIPSWLRDDNRRVGWTPLPPDWFDRLLLLLGLAFLVAGVGAILAAIGGISGVRGL